MNMCDTYDTWYMILLEYLKNITGNFCIAENEELSCPYYGTSKCKLDNCVELLKEFTITE